MLQIYQKTNEIFEIDFSLNPFRSSVTSDARYFIVKIKCHCDFIIVFFSKFLFHTTQCLTFLFLLKIHEIAACQTVIFKNFDKPIKLTAYDSFTIISYFKFQLHTHQFSVQITFRFLLIIHNFKKCYAWFFHVLRTF